MLNLTIAMVTARLLVLLAMLFGFTSAPTFQAESPVLVSPASGEVLQGVVEIRGSTNIEGFQSAEVSFGYQNDASKTWFLISQSSTPVDEDKLAEWDTSTISDGNYKLRVVVQTTDGSQTEAVVEGLRVRNYLPVETAAAVEAQPPLSATEEVVSTPTLTRSTPTPLPENPARLTNMELYSASTTGAVLVLVGAILVGLYFGFKNWIRRR